jgi:hypothetical protein
MTDTTEETTTFNPKRRLCPDGACVGVIGPDGKCTVCGRTAGAAAAGEDAEAYVPAPDEPDDGWQEDRAAAESADGNEAGGGFDSKRRLCPDGACVGVIGPDGKCTVCGRAAES